MKKLLSLFITASIILIGSLNAANCLITTKNGGISLNFINNETNCKQVAGFLQDLFPNTLIKSVMGEKTTNVSGY